jgi:hypothetical protein
VASSATVAGREVGVVALGNAVSDGHLKAGSHPVDSRVSSASGERVHVVGPDPFQFAEVDARGGETTGFVEVGADVATGPSRIGR